MYTHKCIHTVLVNILQYANEYTHPTNLVCLGGGRGRGGNGGVGGVREEREERRGRSGKGGWGGARGKGRRGGAQERGRRSMGRGRGGGRGDRGIKVSYSAVMWSTSRTLQLLDTCRGARCFDCVTDDAAYLAVTDQVSHWLQ